MWSQVGLRKHHYEQSLWMWWNSSWAISNPEIWCCEKVLHSIYQHIWKTQQCPQDWKRSVFIPIPKKGNAKECSNYRTIALISHASKVMLKILQARLQLTELNWTAACQASLSITNSQSLLKLMSIESVMPFNHSLSSPSPPAFNLSQHQDLFQGVGSSHQVAKELEFQLQHQSL